MPHFFGSLLPSIMLERAYGISRSYALHWRMQKRGPLP